MQALEAHNSIVTVLECMFTCVDDSMPPHVFLCKQIVLM